MAGRNISNSEVTSWLSCRLQYYFAYYLNLEPKVMGTPLYRGNIGHEAFQRYAEARIDGKSHEEAMNHSINVFTKAKMQDISRIDTIMQTQEIYTRYQAFHKGWPTLRLLSTEQRFDLPLSSDINMTIRYDVMVEEISTGRVLIGDYKYTYDFWSPEDHALNGQMPKYIQVMRANGYKIDGGFLEELRTRTLSDNGKGADPRNRWRRTTYFPSSRLTKNALRQHVGASLEINRYWSGSDEDREAQNIPVLNKHGACKFCNFKEVCAIKLDDGDWKFQLELQFQPNTYGYNELEIVE